MPKWMCSFEFVRLIHTNVWNFTHIQTNAQLEQSFIVWRAIFNWSSTQFLLSILMHKLIGSYARTL